MSVTSDSLKKPNKIVADSANEIVKSYLKTIDNAIIAAPKIIGTNTIAVDLPTHFPLDGLDKSSGQAMIYSLIIEHLEKEQKLNVGMVLKPDKTVLIVKFKVGPSQVEFAAMKEYVEKHVIHERDIEKFVKNKN
jgi:hypothetical protein